MPSYEVEFTVPTVIRVRVDDVDDREAAIEAAYEFADTFVRSITGDGDRVSAYVTMDGVETDTARRVG